MLRVGVVTGWIDFLTEIVFLIEQYDQLVPKETLMTVASRIALISTKSLHANDSRCSSNATENKHFGSSFETLE